MRETFNPFTNVYELHVEVSDSCNLQCNYCYFVAKNKRKTIFNLDKLDEILAVFFAKTESDVVLVFHGGEPLMNSALWINKACEIAQSHAQANNHKVCFHLQTNGTLLTNAHIDVLARHNFTVNVSLDGPESVNDSARGGYKKTIGAIELLKKANLLTGIITVIGKHNYNHVHEIVELFLTYGISRYHFNVGSILNGNKNLVLSVNEILSFLIDSYVEFTRSYRNSCNWVLLGKLRRFISKEIPSLACDSPICGAAINKIHINQYGNYFPCGSCVSTKEGIDKFLIGNIKDMFLKKEYEQKLSLFHHIYFDHREDCLNCKAKTICDFYCPAFDEFDTITIKNKCEAYKLFFKYLQVQNLKEITDIVDYYENK